MSRNVRKAVSRIFALIATAVALVLPGQASASHPPSEASRSDSQLKAFLISLMNDPAKLVAFRENPEEVLRESDLSPEEKQVLRSGDHKRVRELLAQARPPPPVVHQPPPLIRIIRPAPSRPPLPPTKAPPPTTLPPD